MSSKQLITEISNEAGVTTYQTESVLAALFLKILAKSMGIDVTRVPGDYSLLELKALARELGIETIEELPNNYRGLRRWPQLGDRQN